VACNWHTVIRNQSEAPYAMLDLLPEVANAHREGSTLKYFTSEIAHYPWRLDGATCMPVMRSSPDTVGKDRVIEEHAINEQCALKALVRFFQWMRREGVYDNTQILLVSDHDGNDSASFGKEFDALRSGSATYFGLQPADKNYFRPHALLLVKQRDSRGELRIDPRPMSSADVVPLICAADGPCPGVEYLDPLKNRETPRVRTYSTGAVRIQRHEKGRFITTDFEVRGTMFDPKNWKQVK